ncbi:MFS transporter [Henriciella sp. AS95]|uniref:spinster family MFS transporter n=1 Tax=Henriciella sp. AS95 TaxID=3135782 RepID=UPI00316BA120
MAISGPTVGEGVSGASAGGANEGYSTAGYRAYILGSLLLVYVFNFIDRSILAILNDPIKESLQLEDWHMGLLGGLAFAMLYTTLGIPIARVAERVNRKWIIIVSLLLWSLMTVLCGLATSFIMLFVLRICVGIGEAGCTPPAQSMIADYFKPTSRATAVSIYALGVPLGAMIAGVAGGWINDYVTGENIHAMFGSSGMGWAQGLLDWQSLEGWRLAFILVGLPGVILATILMLTMKEPPRGYTDPPEAVKLEPASFAQVLGILARKPTYIHVVIGAALASFAGYGIGHFVPAYFVRTHELSLSEAAIYYSLILGLCGAIGVFSSGYISDRISSRHPNALSWLPAIGMACAVPLYVFGFLQNVLWLTMPPLMIAALLKYFYLGPMYAVSGGVVDSRMRATSVAITLFFTNLIGLALGPTTSGMLSSLIKSNILSGSDLGLSIEACKVPADLSAEAVALCTHADSKGLQYAIVIFACVYAWAALHYLLAGRTLQRDMVAKSA